MQIIEQIVPDFRIDKCILKEVPTVGHDVHIGELIESPQQVLETDDNAFSTVIVDIGCVKYPVRVLTEIVIEPPPISGYRMAGDD